MGQPAASRRPVAAPRRPTAASKERPPAPPESSSSGAGGVGGSGDIDKARGFRVLVFLPEANSYFMVLAKDL